MVRAGAMRHQVTIQSRSTTQDAAGEQLDTWSTFATRRASLQRTTGREAFAAVQDNGRVPTVFELRWVAGVLPGMRLVHDTQVYNIVSAIDPDNGLKARLVIACDALIGETA